jgi:hypothetical protein
MPAAKKGAGRYKPGAYKRPEPQEIEIDGLGTFLVQPLSTKEQEKIEAEVVKGDSESDTDFNSRMGYAKMSAALIEPTMTPDQIEADSQEWTPRQGGEFATKITLAAQALDEEDFDELRSRFRSAEDE